MKIGFYICAFLVFYTMIGYPLLLKILHKLLSHKKIKIDHSYQPMVSIIVPAHNEENVIEKKIVNLLNISYPKDKYEIIISSDNSTDKTNNIVKSYQVQHKDSIKLYNVESRKGKTNAQDEAVDIAKGEILVFTDANSIFDKQALTELIKTLSDRSVGYVAGKLSYLNSAENKTSESEASYWNIDLSLRLMESDLSSITAGNGSIYAVRKDDYIKIDPTFSHDSIFPPKLVNLGKRAVFNKDAIAFEKAGETDSDEFIRKVRMARKNIAINFIDIQKYNIQRNKLFSLFYISHRTFRNNLYLFHILLLLFNIFMVIQSNYLIYAFFLVVQILFFVIAIVGKNSVNKYIKLIFYYTMTIVAQAVAAFKEITGKSKAFWEKADTTR